MAKKSKKLALKKDPLVKKYLASIWKSDYRDTLEAWKIWGDELEDLLEIENIDYQYLGALVDLMNAERQEVHQYKRYALMLKNNYNGTKELRVFINKMKKKEVIPVMISIDFKALYKNDDKSKLKKGIKKLSSEVMKLKGKYLVQAIVSQIAGTNFKNTLDVFEGLIDKPPIDIKNYPDKENELNARTTKKAVKKFFIFFKSQNVQERDSKIATIKSLIHIKFVKSYKQYKIDQLELGKKPRQEEEYYLSRYLDLSKAR